MKTICAMRDVFKAMGNFETAFEKMYQITLNEAQSIPGTSTVLVSGENIPKLTNSKVALATVVIIARLEILAPILAPTKRPISIINQ